MNFRLAKDNDFQSIVRIEQDAFKKDAWTLSQIKEELIISSSKKSYVLLKGKSIIGYLMCRQVMNEHEIINFAIQPLDQGAGNGQIMLEKYFETIQDDSSVFLDVKRTNYPAIKLYLECGFEEIDIRQNYYQDGEDAIVMKRGKIRSHVMV